MLPSSEEEARHITYRTFLHTLEALAAAPETQCELMGDFNTAWEMRDDALAGHYLMGTGFFSAPQESAVLELLAAVRPIPVNDMPAGSGRAVNLAAMRHPAWEPIRDMARNLIMTLAPLTEINREYLRHHPDMR
ncbi:hypothetical protein FKV24_014605 [Lysobacter maris]|uniref:Uncharacterized protein n=1 Tax=Marilutibacter maris TaxID=1605891 RepID=A0A508A611_9GAMM|nr:hypothetical protein [Lysobacter maris]KAB8172514.1 hypothetical protein FKV24_014605 [Lysobacter maris]